MNPRLYRPLALLVVLAGYAAVASAGLVWDDNRLLGANAVIEHPTWELVFGRDLWCCVEGTPPSPYYRPMMTLTVLLDHVAWPSAAGAHLQSLAWHLAATALLGSALARRVGEERAAVACLVFGLHPIQSEAVVWIAARNDLLVTAFVLTAIRATDRDRPALAAAGALLACLSKESGLLVCVYVWLWRRLWGERLPVRPGLALALGTSIALALRLSATLGVASPEMIGPTMVVDRLASAAGRYAAWTSWPWPLTGTMTVYSLPPGGWTWLAATATCALAFVAWRRGAGWGLALAAAGLAPSVGGIAQYGTLGERYLYLAMVGVAASVAVAIRMTLAARAVLAAWVLGSLCLVQVRLADWADDVTFFGAAAQRSPDSYTLSRLGEAHAARAEWREALMAFDAALRAKPRIAKPCIHVATMGSELLGPDSFAERVAAWSKAGCPEVPGYADEAALTLAREGRWGDAARLLDGVADGTGRLALVAGGVHEVDGDLLGEAAIAVSDPRGAGSFRADVAELVYTHRAAPLAGPLTR